MKLNQFVDEWSDDPIGMALFCGQAIGTSTYIHSFFEGFGSSITTNSQACARIDFLYSSDLKPARDPKVFKQCVQVGTRNGVPWVKDIIGDHRHFSAMFIKGAEEEAYSIRLFCDEDDSNAPRCLLKKCDDPSFESVLGKQVTHSYVSPFTGKHEKVDYDYCGEFNHLFWNFKPTMNGVEIESRSEGFADLMATKVVMSFLVWTSNMLGF